MSEANAKMHLREFVSEEDINVAIRMELESFVNTQKYSVMKDMKKVFQALCRKMIYKNICFSNQAKFLLKLVADFENTFQLII